MKKDISWVTIIEIIIASVFFALIFTWLFSWIAIISSYVKESNIKLNSMNLARVWVEKFEAYKTNFKINNTNDSWRKFFYDNSVWYYIFSWTSLRPEKIFLDGDRTTLDFSNWEWPLDEKWDRKNNNNWVSYYRLLKISDFDTISVSNDLKSSIFDCNINDNFCNTWIQKGLLSDPFLSWAVLSSSWLTLEFSTWSIFNTKSIFIVDLNWSWSITSTSFTMSTWVINWNNIAYIDFSSITDINSLSWKTISLSWITSSWSFTFWGNIDIWWSIDRAIFNLKNEISTNTEDFIAYIFYPNSCQLHENFIFYNTLSDTKFSFPNDFSSDCSNTDINIDNNKITLSGSFITNNINQDTTIIPKYITKLDLWISSNDYTLFSKLNSPKTTKYWLKLWEKWVSSIYLLWVRVIWIDNWNIVADEIFEKYIVDI